MHPELWCTTLGLWFTSTLLNLLNLSELWSCSVERSIVTLLRSGSQVSSRPVNTPWAVNKSRVHHFMRVPPHANTWRLKHLALSLSWPTLADIKTCERWMKHCSGRNERQTQCIGRCTGLTRNVTQILPEETLILQELSPRRKRCQANWVICVTSKLTAFLTLASDHHSMWGNLLAERLVVQVPTGTR